MSNMYILGIILLLAMVAVGVWWSSNIAEERVSGENPTQPVQPDIAEDQTEAEPESVLPGSGGSIEVYDGISVARDIQVLNLSGRGLEGSLKAEVRQLTELRELDISNNSFTGLPAEIGQLSKLQKLDLSNNPFTGLPYELGNLKNLEVLNLSGTMYAEQDLAVIQQSLPANTIVITE